MDISPLGRSKSAFEYSLLARGMRSSLRYTDDLQQATAKALGCRFADHRACHGNSPRCSCSVMVGQSETSRTRNSALFNASHSWPQRESRTNTPLVGVDFIESMDR
jgi:hypothetical protein